MHFIMDAVEELEVRAAQIATREAQATSNTHRQ